MSINLKLPARPWLLLLSVAAIVVATTGGAIAGHISNNVKSYSGCLTPGGTLVDIQEGDSPAKPCSKGAVEAHFGGGDITAVTAGFGLAGGGTNGAVELALDPAFALPDDCTSGQVVKWNSTSDSWACASDNDTTYSAGTGLDLTGTEFSLNSSYRLPDAANGDSIIFNVPGGWTTDRFAKAGESCPSGQFVRATTNNGFLTCAAPSSGGSASLPAVWVSRVFDANAPQGFFHQVASLELPGPASYLVTATTSPYDGSFGGDDMKVRCELRLNGTRLVSSDESADTDGGVGSLALTDVVTLTANAVVSVHCRSSVGSDSVFDTRLTALQVSAVHEQ